MRLWTTQRAADGALRGATKFHARHRSQQAGDRNWSRTGGGWAIYLTLGLSALPGWAQAPATAVEQAPASEAAPAENSAREPAVIKNRALLEAMSRYIPDDTVLLVLIPDSDQLAQRCEAFGRAIGVDSLAEHTLGGLLQTPFGDSSDAIRGDSPLLIAISSTFIEPLMIAALTEKQPWKEQAKATPINGGHARYELTSGQTFVSTKDNLALFGRDEIDLEAALEAGGKFGKQALQAAQEALRGHDVVVYADLRAAKPVIKLAFATLDGALRAGTVTSDHNPEVDLAAMQALLGSVRQMLDDADSYVAGLALSADEVFFRDWLEPREGTETRAYLTKCTRGQADLWRGLDDQPATAWFAYEWTPPPGTLSLNQRMVRAMMTLPSVQEKLGEAGVEKLAAQMMKLHEDLMGQNCRYTLDPEKGGLLEGVHFTTRPEGMRADIIQLAQDYPDGLSSLGFGAPSKMSHAREEIEGRPVDFFRIEFTEMEQAALEILRTFYGRDCQFALFERSGGVGYAIGESRRVRSFVVEQLRGKLRPAGENKALMAFTRRFSPKPQALVALDLPAITKAGFIMAKAAGLPIIDRAEAPPPQPYAGFALYLDERRLRNEVFAPTAAIQAVVKMSKEISFGGSSSAPAGTITIEPTGGK